MKINEGLSPKKAAKIIFDKLVFAKLIGNQNRRRGEGIIEFQLRAMRFGLDEATATAKSNPAYFKGLSPEEKKERERVIARRSKMDDDDPDAYKDFDTDKGEKTKPSKHTNKFKKMFGEAGWKALKEVWNETKTIKEAPADKALANKAKKTGIPKGILRQVYNRGMAAWKTGHRPGASQQQWGMARVNSFATKGSGTWGKADKDLAAKARKAKKKKK
jgi:hypothetical protein|tara:strand:- start:211 stop:861 length:651 start_codon:yes stop_codon:yes gene_type:complete